MWASLREAFCDAFFPIRSLAGREGEWVSRDELMTLRHSTIRLERTQMRKRGMRSVDRLIAVGPYNDPLLRRAIWTLKYRRLSGIAVPLGSLLCDAVMPHILDEGVLCPVPLHWMRKFARGFNQASLLARSMAQQCDLPVQELLRRVRLTGSQARRSREERRRALTHAFHCSYTAPASVILVDDVATSGATLEACARELRKHGTQTVVAVVLALG
jgi:ComF family protein